MIVYKLTDKKGRTYGSTQWGEDVTHTIVGDGLEFCSHDLIHSYSSPLLAVLMNPFHAGFSNPQLWEAEGEVVASDNGLKLGHKSLTTLRRIRSPHVTTVHRIRFAILCSAQVYNVAEWISWAQNWLDNVDRSSSAAAHAAYAAYADRSAAYAAYAAAYAAAYSAAARSAAYAAYAAAYSAADAPAYAAYAAASADAAVVANDCARATQSTATITSIDLDALAVLACSRRYIDLINQKE